MAPTGKKTQMSGQGWGDLVVEYETSPSWQAQDPIHVLPLTHSATFKQVTWPFCVSVSPSVKRGDELDNT